MSPMPISVSNLNLVHFCSDSGFIVCARHAVNFNYNWTVVRLGCLSSVWQTMAISNENRDRPWSNLNKMHVFVPVYVWNVGNDERARRWRRRQRRHMPHKTVTPQQWKFCFTHRKGNGIFHQVTKWQWTNLMHVRMLMAVAVAARKMYNKTRNAFRPRLRVYTGNGHSDVIASGTPDIDWQIFRKW